MRVAIDEVRADGVIVSTNDGNKGWIRSAEWSTVASAWRSASLTLEKGTQIDVVPLSTKYNGLAELSRRAFTIEHVDSSWYHETRDFTVIEVGRTLIRGLVGGGVLAVVDRQKYLEWIDSRRLSPELIDHSVVSAGDVLRGRVKPTTREFGAIELDWAGHLASFERTLAEEVGGEALDRHTSVRPSELPPAVQAIPHDLGTRISPVLLLDDNLGCRESIATLLRHLDADVTVLQSKEEGSNFLKAVNNEVSSRGNQDAFRLAIIDANLEASSNDLAGLQIADTLTRVSRCRVVLMTGELTTQKKLALWPHLRVYGYIEKPFTADAFLQALSEACALKAPISLGQWLHVGLGSGVAVSTSPANAEVGKEPRPLTYDSILHALGSLKSNAALHIFEFHPRSLRARSIASIGPPFNWVGLSGKLAKSVIKDAAFSRSALLESDATSNPAHLWTLQMMSYRSFCGVPVTVPGRRLALVAFHAEANAFGNPFVSAARLAAEQVGRVTDRDMLYSTRGNEAQLASFGMALASLAHELSSDVTALSANLSALQSSMATPPTSVIGKTGTDALSTLGRVRANVDEISSKTRILRGARGRGTRVSVAECVRKAAAACRTVVAETVARPERIQIAPLIENAEDSDVIAPAASLTIVFFNLFLNAAQQIDLASGVRASGKIWATLERFAEARRRVWLRVRVYDTGPGIHADDIQRVFDAGYSTKPNGSGLGLYISRDLIRECGGSLDIGASRVWDGTTVVVTLPAARSDKAPQR